MPEEKSVNYIANRKRLSGIIFETALPNEYLIQVGKKNVKPVLGGRRIRVFRKFIRVPASVQTLYFSTDNANVDYQGIGIEGYASWRIDPGDPVKAITTLDFFDENDPMARTNSELRTICIEAVRHVIANMTIDEAMKKKEEIAVNLKEQLEAVEKRWGIIFDQVGIEQVKVMSERLFVDLQSQFRDKLRLDVARTRISTDREIATEESDMKEKTGLKAIDTEKKIELSRIDSKTRLREYELEEQRNISSRERDIREEEFRKENTFQREQEKLRFDQASEQKGFEIKLASIETELLKLRDTVEALTGDIARKQLEIEKSRREIEQIFSSDAILSRFVELLPQLFKSIHIDNYSVLDAGQGGTISPVTRLVQELLVTLKNSDLPWVSEKKEKE